MFLMKFNEKCMSGAHDASHMWLPGGSEWLL